MNQKNQNDTETNLAVMEKPETKKALPPLYKVIMWNDDYTPVDFVVTVLMQIFQKNMQESVNIANNIHNSGSAVIAIYPKGVAEFKKKAVDRAASANDFILKVTVEPDTPAPEHKPKSRKP